MILSLLFKKITKRDINFNAGVFSDVPIDVVIPAIEKDYDVLVYVIDSVRENVKHPIGDILIISPRSDAIINLCKEKKCRFIDENLVLPITRKDIDYFVDGIDRSGWLFQQLLKWGSVDFVNNEYFLVADADTVFCRPQIFIWKGRMIFSINDAIPHIPYVEVYNRIFQKNISASKNFVSHHSLVKKDILFDLIKKIEGDSSVPWFEVILNSINKNEASSFAEYDTYGYFVFNNYREGCILEHWCNLSLSRKELKNIDSLINKHSSQYKTISFHSYNK